jgi:hypothetical protein
MLKVSLLNFERSCSCAKFQIFSAESCICRFIQKPVFQAFYSPGPKIGFQRPFLHSFDLANGNSQNKPAVNRFLPAGSFFKLLINQLNSNILRQSLVFASISLVFTIQMFEAISIGAGIFMRTGSKFLGQHINSCSRVIHTSLPANKIKLSFIFVAFV